MTGEVHDKECVINKNKTIQSASTSSPIKKPWENLLMSNTEKIRRIQERMSKDSIEYNKTVKLLDLTNRNRNKKEE